MHKGALAQTLWRSPQLFECISTILQAKMWLYTMLYFSFLFKSNFSVFFLIYPKHKAQQKFSVCWPNNLCHYTLLFQKQSGAETEALAKSGKLESHFGLFPLRHNYKRGKVKLPWVEGPWVVLRSDHLFPLQELLDPLPQRGKIMDPEGGSLALSEGRSEMMRRFLVLYRCLLTLQDSIDLYLAWRENAVLSRKHNLSKGFPREHWVVAMWIK